VTGERAGLEIDKIELWINQSVLSVGTKRSSTSRPKHCAEKLHDENGEGVKTLTFCDCDGFVPMT